MPKLSIVIPAYNEADRICRALRETSSYLERQGLDAELVVVNDGSSDATSDVVRAFIADAPEGRVRLLEHRPNRGKGAAVCRGMLESAGEVRLFMDADLATPVEEIGNLLPSLAEADVVIASRALATSKLPVQQPLHRQVMGWVFRRLVNLAGVAGIRDSQCGFKFFRAEAAQEIFSRTTERGFVFDVEVLALAARLGYRIKEVGVTWSDSGRSSVDPLRDPIRMFFALWRIRRRCASVAPVTRARPDAG